jgi:enamine deaminase RidA (YjgF/YER057c/UK114 family)
MSSIQKINSPDNASYPHILSHAVKIPIQSSLVYLSGQTPHLADKTLAPGGIAEHTVRPMVTMLRRILIIALLLGPVYPEP